MTYQSECFAALADPTRRMVFERLGAGPLSVGKLSEGLPVSRPAVSQHLKVLHDAGLVLREREGTRQVYRINQQGILAMRHYLDRFWDRSLAAFQKALEKETDS